MVIKINAYIEIEGHLDNPSASALLLSSELQHFLVSEKIQLSQEVIAQLKKMNPKFEKGTFTNQEAIFQKLRKGN